MLLDARTETEDVSRRAGAADDSGRTSLRSTRHVYEVLGLYLRLGILACSNFRVLRVSGGLGV